MSETTTENSTVTSECETKPSVNTDVPPLDSKAECGSKKSSSPSKECGGKDEDGEFKEMEITVCPGRWKLSRARKPSKRKKSSMHRKSKSTPTNYKRPLSCRRSRPSKSMTGHPPIRRSNSYESLPQLQSGMFPPYTVPVNNIQSCFVNPAVPQLTMLHAIPSETSQPTTEIPTSSTWNASSNAPSPWGYPPPLQNVAHATATPIVHVKPQPNSNIYKAPSSSTDYSNVAKSSSTSERVAAPSSTFNYDQYVVGDGLQGWDENAEYATAPTYSNSDSAAAPTQKTGAASNAENTTKKNTEKAPRGHGRSLSATNRREMSRRSARKKKISDAIQSLKEIMMGAGMQGIPADQNGIIQAAVKFMKILRSTLESATNQYARLAERFAEVNNCPVPVLQPLANTAGSGLHFVALATPTATLPTSTLPAMPPLTSSPLASPTSTDSIPSPFAGCGRKQTQRSSHPRPSVPEHPQRRRRRRRRQQKQQQEVPVHATSNSFAEEVRKRIHSRHESVGATSFAKMSMGEDTHHSDHTRHSDHSDLEQLVDTKTMTSDSLFNFDSHLDVDFLPSSIAVDAGLLRSIDALTSPTKSSPFSSPPSSPQLLLPLSLCTSPNTFLFKS